MKIPKKIDTLITRRRKLAEELNAVDFDLCEWIEQQGMDLLEMRDFTLTGCMIYCEPVTAEQLVREAIENFKKTEEKRNDKK